jgi:hypothetical protein
VTISGKIQTGKAGGTWVSYIESAGSSKMEASGNWTADMIRK